MLALVLVAVLAGCSSGEARTVPTTVPPVTAKDGRFSVYQAIGTDGDVAGIELAIADINRAGGVHGHRARMVGDADRADLVIGGKADNAPDAEPVAADDDFADRLRQVEPTVTDVERAAIVYAEVRKAAADAKADEL